MTDEKKTVGTEKVWNRSFICVFLTSMFLNSAFWTIVPMVSSYCLELRSDLKTASAVASLMSMAAMFLRPVAGMISDQVNRKRLILLTIVSNVALAVLHIFASDVRVLAVVRILQGVAFSFASVAIMAFGTVFIPESRLGEGMGWLSLAHVISQSLGPGIGVYLIEHYGYTACFIGSAVISLMALASLLAVRYEEEKREFTFRKLSLNDIILVPVLPYAAILAFFSACSGLDNTFIALIGKERSIAGFSLFFTAYSVAMFLTRPVFGKLLDRKGLDLVIYPSLFAMAASGFLTGAAASTVMLILSACFKAVGMSAGSQGIQATCVKKMGKERAGVVSSTCFIGQDSGNVLGPILGSLAVEKYGYKNMYWGYGVLTVIAGSVIYALIRMAEKKKVE
ncbi:MAG: MFS transporter [Oscillospiraceae bacterium]|nr:MFS transporter [Oscillospiraceae bacterium]